MWPFNSKENKNSNFKFSTKSFRREFISDNIDIIINNLLRDTFELGVDQSKTYVPIFPKLLTSLTDATKNNALSLFEVCFETIRRGSFEFTFLNETRAGFVEGQINSEKSNYESYESVNPYSIKDKKPLWRLLEVPLILLYYSNRNIIVKDEIFTNRFILYIDRLRDYGSGNSSSYMDEFKQGIKDSVKEIINEQNNVWVFDAKDRIETPQLVDTDFQNTVNFAYQEISRITGIPLTRLIGKSPDGMNATGDSDEENYRKTLEGILNGLVLPILLSADPSYKVDHDIDILQINQALSTLNSLDLVEGLSVKEKANIKQILMNKIGIGDR